MGRTCRACGHPERPSLNLAHARGEPNRSIAAQFELSPGDVRRHRAHSAVEVRAAAAHDRYVGRLLRSHAGKHRVELHDYVDARIPVLRRMHAKRLPAYTALGFDIPKSGRRARPVTGVGSTGAAEARG